MIIAFLVSLRCHNNCYANDGLQLFVRFLVSVPLSANSAPHHTIDNCSVITKMWKISQHTFQHFCLSHVQNKGRVDDKIGALYIWESNTSWILNIQKNVCMLQDNTSRSRQSAAKCKLVFCSKYNTQITIQYSTPTQYAGPIYIIIITQF